MSESNEVNAGHQPEIDSIAKEPLPLGWRRASMGLGLFTMVLALFAAASGNGTAGSLGKLFLVVAFVLIAVPIAVNIVNSVSSKIKHISGTTARPGS